jgi:hypothetical protein
MKKCTGCGRFYNQQKDDKMCGECKRHYEIAFHKLKNNKALHDVMLRLADR